MCLCIGVSMTRWKELLSPVRLGQVTDKSREGSNPVINCINNMYVFLELGPEAPFYSQHFFFVHTQNNTDLYAEDA